MAAIAIAKNGFLSLWQINMRLLADAGFLISLIKEGDRNHYLSIKKIEGLKTAIVLPLLLFLKQ